MNLVQTFSHGVSTTTFDGDTGVIYYHVLVNGKLVWRREARPGTHNKNLDALARAQMAEALHLVAIAEEEMRRYKQAQLDNQ